MRLHWLSIALVTLLLFVVEMMREGAVLDFPLGQSKTFGASGIAFGDTPYFVRAEGAWLVVNGKQLDPHSVTIVCDIPAQICRQTTASLVELIDLKKLWISDDLGKITSATSGSVSYTIDRNCVTDLTTIDISQRRVMAQRVPKLSVDGEYCGNDISPRPIETELSDSKTVRDKIFDEKADLLTLPLFALMWGLIK